MLSFGIKKADKLRNRRSVLTMGRKDADIVTLCMKSGVLLYVLGPDPTAPSKPLNSSKVCMSEASVRAKPVLPCSENMIYSSREP